MLKTIHKYQNTILVYVMAFLVCVAMLGFGVDFFNKPAETYAIKIDDTLISYSDFADKRRNFEDMLRQQYGEIYQQIIGAGGINVNQQVVDAIIPSTLLQRFAKANGLTAGDGEVRSSLEKLMPGGFNAASYRGFLQRIGMTASQFESELASEALSNQFSDIVEVAARPSRREVQAYFEREETSYNAQSVVIDPARYVDQVKVPNDSELESWYLERATDYEQPERVRYDFVRFKPADYIQTVEILPEDVEIYYTDHPNEFSTPEELKARLIQLNFPEQSDPALMAKVKERADELLGKVTAGEDIAPLALQYSDDVASKTLGGDLGWIKKGTRSKEFDEAVFGMKGPGIAKLVETSYGYEIVKVEEYKPSGLKKLDEVQKDIEQTLRVREAPAYTLVKAQEKYDEWSKGTASLADFASQNELEVTSGTELLTEVKDPVKDVMGLSKEVLTNPTEAKQIVELGDLVFLVEVKEYKEKEVPAFASIKDKVISDYKTRESKRLAKEAADKLAADISGKSVSDFSAAAKGLGLEVEEAKEIRHGKPAEGIYNNPEVSQAVFSSGKAGDSPGRSFEISGKYYVVQVTAVTPPNSQDLDKKFEEYAKKAQSASKQMIMSALVNQLKARSVIDIDPSILATDES